MAAILRLPPALRGLLTTRVLYRHGRASPLDSSAFEPARSATSYHYHELEHLFFRRAYASAAPDQSTVVPRLEEMELARSDPPTSIFPPISAHALAVLEQLEAGCTTLDDETYDAVERDLLLAFFRAKNKTNLNAKRCVKDSLASKDTLNTLRYCALGFTGLPPPLRMKATARLQKEVGGLLAREWHEILPNLGARLESACLTNAQIIEAKELLDILWAARLNLRAHIKRAQFESLVGEALLRSDLVTALKQLVADLPQARRDRIESARKGGNEREQSNSARVDKQEGTRDELPGYLSDLLTVDRLLKEYPLPAEDDLPRALANIMDPKLVAESICASCDRRKEQIEYLHRYHQYPISHEKKRPDMGHQAYYTCNLSLKIAGMCRENVHGDGFRKTEAKRAAWIHLVSRLYSTGVLSQLFEEPKHADVQKGANDPKSSHSSGDKALQEPLRLADLEHIQSTCELPSKEWYAGVPEALLGPKSAFSIIQHGCQTAKLSLESEADYTVQKISEAQLRARPTASSHGYYFCCTIKMSIDTLCRETGYGEGLNKIEARQAAWLKILSELHTSGALSQLFPEVKAKQRTSIEVPATNTVAEDNAEADDVEDVVELTTVDSQTMKEEKDAKIEIFNYMAAFGLVPRFEMQVIQPRTPRARLGRIPKKPTPVVQVAVRVDELSIDVTATGADLRTAEVAAALAFKEKAEERRSSDESLEVSMRFKALNTDNAKQFLDFCKNHGVELSLQMEVERQDGRLAVYHATPMSDGEILGQQVAMQRKEDAKAAAYLTCALQVAKRNPNVFGAFSRALEKGDGKLLKELEPIDLELDPNASQVMRDALIEAHATGLPMSHEILAAETTEDDELTSRPRSVLSEAEATSAKHRLLQEQKTFDILPDLHELREKKASLPMSQYRSELLEMINGHPYSIVIGATGSGKTTQVPQALFEDAVRRLEGPYCNVICTQPRRIAATSVAQRVAEERNEPLRKTVGYHVRFDAKPPYNPYGINYCTTGILLQRLKHDPESVLDTTSHILVDEVHERDLLVDFLMIVLKKAIRARQAEGKKVPKVVLMSATLDTELFANYFNHTGEDGETHPAPCLSVPGRTFPVKEKYLGSIMHELLEKNKQEVGQLIEADKDSNNFLKVETDYSSTKSTGQLEYKPVIDWKRERTGLDNELEPSAKEERDEALVPVGLLAATIAHICATAPDDGAILAFLPGLQEINNTEATLLRGPIFGLHFGDPSKFKICLLHSSVPKEQQAEIFEPTPPGCRKIILSTNIAETSVTVADVKYVVDTGKLRESRYDQLRRITKLQCVWESKSNSKQRMGRAGRVQDGFYFALFSKERAESLRAIGLPELLRSDLQETCLSIKAQKFDEPVASFLAQAIEPPSSRAVDAAVQNLTSIGAYMADEKLTSLGRVLSHLPVHPALGKMILLGIIFKCLDPMITLGAAAEERPLLVNPPGLREEAAREHSAYAGTAQSDHLAFLAAFQDLRQYRHNAGVHAAYSYAREKYLHFGAFRNIDQTARQIVQILHDTGLIPASSSTQTSDSDRLYGPANLNANSTNDNLIKSLLLAGLHPNLAIKRTSKGIMYRTPLSQECVQHATSVNKERKKSEKYPLHAQNTMWTYSTLARSNDGSTLFLRESTRVEPLMSLLFGGEFRTEDAKKGKLEVDGWVPFRVKGGNEEYSSKLILEFRKALERVLGTAYASLADLGRDGGEEGQGAVRGSWEDDPVREKFAARVVQVLGGGVGKKGVEGWSSGWGVS